MILLGNPYVVTKQTVSWGSKLMPDADAKTFRHLGGEWGRDDRHIFVSTRVTTIDAATFRYLNPVFVTDADGVYNPSERIEGADPATFETIDPGVVLAEYGTSDVWASGYARDARGVYYFDAFSTSDGGVVKGADPHRFVSFRNNYGADDDGVWFAGSRLTNADPKTWTYLGRQYSIDCERIFFRDEPMPKLDRDSFTVLAIPTGGPLATDGERFYFGRRRIDEDEFWQELTQFAGKIEESFRDSFHRIRRTCPVCKGSGECYCQRKGSGDAAACPRCHGTHKCHLCNKGRVRWRSRNKLAPS